jgi:hypothetical protein
LNHQLSLPASTMSQWWVTRSSSAIVILASRNTLGSIIEANKLDHQIDDGGLEWIRKGAAAARALADELARIANRMEGSE